MSDFLQSLYTAATSRLTVAGIEFQFTVMQLLVELILPIAAYVAGAVVVRRVLAGWRKRAAWTDETKEKFRVTVTRVINLTGLFLAVLLIGRLLGAQIMKTFQEVWRILSQPLLESGSTRISVITLLLILPVLLVAGRIGVAVKSYSRTRILSRLDPDRQSMIAELLRYSTAIIVAIIGISILGINLSSLAVLFGVMGIGIGFGLQEVIANMFAGLIIILVRPIKEGDRVLSGEYEGNVVSIRLLNTAINTLTNETIIVPNSILITKEVYNFSFDSPSIILVNQVQVSYNSDLDAVLELLQHIPERNPYVLAGKPHKAYVKSFDDSGITVELRTWIRTVYDKMAAHSWVNLEIWREFKAAGVQIPYPQLDLHIQKESPPAT